MANYRAAARRAARRYGLDPGVFSRQIQQESSFNPHASSGKAFGIAQLTPDTARGLGVNPNDPIASLDAAAKLMAGYVKKYGGYANALRAYNAGPGAIERSKGYAETNNYVKTILGGSSPSTRGVKAGAGVGAAVEHLKFSPDLSASQTVTELMSSLATQQKPTAPSAPLQAPSFSAQAPSPAGYQPVSSGGGPSTPGQDSSLTDALSKLSQIQGTLPTGLTGQGSNATAIHPEALKGAKGVGNFAGKPVAAWIAPVLRYARSQGWKGSVNSGYRSTAEQKRIYDSGVRPAAKPGTSNHEFTAFPGGAIDVSDAAQLSKILRASKYRKLLVWAGSKDPVHFSHPHGGSY